MPRYAVVILNMGGPDSLAAVKPFLVNLFSDRDIFKIPLGQALFARLLAARRAPHVREHYRQIGGKSPLNIWTEAQRTLLEQALQSVHPGLKVFTAMRYWHPTIKAVAAAVAADGFAPVVLLPLYPHYSITTTGSAFNEWRRTYPGDPACLRYVRDYFDNPTYIEAINRRIDEALARFPQNVSNDVQILFSAHGTPMRLVAQGDPYQAQIQETVRGVMAARHFSHAHHLSYQSKVGPLRWLGPATSEKIRELAADGKRQLLIVPVSFVSDHIETLFELDIEYRALAEELGFQNYVVMTGLNDSTTFRDALVQIVRDALETPLQ